MFDWVEVQNNIYFYSIHDCFGLDVTFNGQGQYINFVGKVNRITPEKFHDGYHHGSLFFGLKRTLTYV